MAKITFEYSPQNSALLASYTAGGQGPWDGSQEESDQLSKIAKKVAKCATCGKELMTIGGKLKHHDGRYTYGPDTGAHDGNTEANENHSPVEAPRKTAKTVVVKKNQTTAEGLLKPAVERNQNLNSNQFDK
jgi:hypothetical protein